MTYFPYSSDLQTAAGTDKNFDKFKNGNFGLWFNKFVPLKSDGDPKASNFGGNDKEPVEYYQKQYTANVDDLLMRKHLNQFSFCKTMESLGYKSIVFHAKLKTPLITGIGESHPHEIGMVFDHTLGVPYIPASGIKGVSRLNYILNNLDGFQEEENDIINLDGNDDFIKSFGSQEQRGNIILFDAYSIKTPMLKADIMTPHYGNYYSDDTNRTPPADNQNPTPIKFLTVKEGTEFVFRALVKDADVEKAKKALKNALENGVGAKTALGYGVFEIIDVAEPEVFLSPEEKESIERKRQAFQKDEEIQMFIARLTEGDRDNMNDDELMNKLKLYNNNEEIAHLLLSLIKTKKKKGFTNNYNILRKILGESKHE